MERDADLLATFQPYQRQNASQELHADSALCLRCMSGWGHVPNYYVTDQQVVGDYERTGPDST